MSSIFLDRSKIGFDWAERKLRVEGESLIES